MPVAAQAKTRCAFRAGMPVAACLLFTMAWRVVPGHAGGSSTGVGSNRVSKNAAAAVFPGAGSFRAVDASFEMLCRRVSFGRAFTPLNATAAKRKFRRQLHESACAADPVFRYRDGPARGLAMARVLVAIARTARELSNLNLGLPSHPLVRLYLTRLEKLRHKAAFLGRWAFWGKRGEGPGWREIYSIFEAPDSEAFAAALAIVGRAADLPAPQDKTGVPAFGHRKMARLLKSYATFLGMRPLRVKYRRTMAGRVSVSPVSGRVSLRRGASFGPGAWRRLAVHEIGTHMARAENGRRLTGGLAILSLTADVDTEEGLAKYMEKAAGVADDRDDLWMALRTMADHYGRRDSFGGLFKRAVNWLKPLGYEGDRLFDSAWSLAFRAKRGLRDTSLLHTYPKDASYLRGYLELSKRLGSPMKFRSVSRRDTMSLNALLSGKWSVDELVEARAALAKASREGIGLIDSVNIVESLEAPWFSAVGNSPESEDRHPREWRYANERAN